MKPPTPAEKHGAVMWLYCVTDQRRRVVKVGISGNVPRRTRAVSNSGTDFLRHWLGVSVPGNRAAFTLVRTWPLGCVTRSEAMALEAVAHAAIRERCANFAGEWFHIAPSKAIALIEKSCRFTEAA